KISQNTFTALDAVANLHRDLRASVHNNVYARSKLDESHTLAASDLIADFVIEHDSTRNQARDLLEYDGLTFAVHRHDVLFVLVRRICSHGIQELAALVTDIANDSSDRRTVDVHLKDIQEDTDARAAFAFQSVRRNIGYLAVSGRDDGPRRFWNGPLGIAEKP